MSEADSATPRKGRRPESVRTWALGRARNERLRVRRSAFQGPAMSSAPQKGALGCCGCLGFVALLAALGAFLKMQHAEEVAEAHKLYESGSREAAVAKY